MSSARSGFTIVELIVVIVVIGILSTIGVIGYGSSVRNAQSTQIKNDLSHAASSLQSAVNFSDSGYASDVLTEYTPNDGTVMTGGSVNSGTGYCVQAYHTNAPATVYYIDNTTATTGAVLGSCT